VPALIDQVRQTRSVAILDLNDSTSLTYGEFYSRTNQFAQYLRQLGGSPGTRIAIFMHRSIGSIISMLAILKAGYTYVPIDPNCPSDRAAYILADSDASMIITQESLLDFLPQTKIHPICLDRDENLWSSESTHNLLPAIDGNQLAYIIYTSGTTGNPKGVMIKHPEFLLELNEIARPQCVSEDGRVVVMATRR
jgi:non-ribosomal peptide synthetase component F